MQGREVLPYQQAAARLANLGAEFVRGRVRQLYWIPSQETYVVVTQHAYGQVSLEYHKSEGDCGC